MLRYSFESTFAKEILVRADCTASSNIAQAGGFVKAYFGVHVYFKDLLAMNWKSKGLSSTVTVDIK